MKKSQIEHIVRKLPDNVDVDALIDQLQLLERIDWAEQQLSRGEGIPHDAVRLRLETLLA